MAKKEENRQQHMKAFSSGMRLTVSMWRREGIGEEENMSHKHSENIA